MGVGGSLPIADFVARVLSCSSNGRMTPEAMREAESTIIQQASGNEQYFHLMEERRVCYVAFTRAKRFLLLTAPLADKNNHPLQPSRFFREACLVRRPPAQLLAVQTPEMQRFPTATGAQAPVNEESLASEQEPADFAP